MNDDITAFLPADTDTRRGLTVMEEEFVTYADAKVMLANTTYERAEAVAEEIRALEHVTGVELDDSPAHFVNSAALLTVSFDTEADDPRAEADMDAIRAMTANSPCVCARRRAALRAVGRRGSLAQLHARRELYRVCSGKRRLGDICRDGADGVPVARHRRRRGCHSRRGGISAVSAEEKTARPRGKRRAGRISKIPHMTMPLRMKIRRGNSFKC